jgi:galactonate dehydratase
MQNFIITEYFLPFEEIGAKLCPNLLKPVDGYIALPEGPGLGLDVNEAVVRATGAQQYPARSFRLPKDEGP